MLISIRENIKWHSPHNRYYIVDEIRKTEYETNSLGLQIFKIINRNEQVSIDDISNEIHSKFPNLDLKNIHNDVQDFVEDMLNEKLLVVSNPSLTSLLKTLLSCGEIRFFHILLVLIADFLITEKIDKFFMYSNLIYYNFIFLIVSFAAAHTVNHYLDYEEDLISGKQNKNPIIRNNFNRKVGVYFSLFMTTLVLFLAFLSGLETLFIIIFGAILAFLYSGSKIIKLKKFYISEYIAILIGYTVTFLAAIRIVTPISLKSIIQSIFLSSFFFKWIRVKDLAYAKSKLKYQTLFDVFPKEKALQIIIILYFTPEILAFIMTPFRVLPPVSLGFIFISTFFFIFNFLKNGPNSIYDSIISESIQKITYLQLIYLIFSLFIQFLF